MEVCREGALHGYAGTWTFFRADSAEDKDINSWFRCLRTYEVVGESSSSGFIIRRQLKKSDSHIFIRCTACKAL